MKHLRSNAIAYLALFLALGGGAYAATHINGRAIKRNSLPGNRLKPNSVTGKQVKESKLGTVPKAALATTATNADHATNALNASAIGGVGAPGLGPGLVSGLMLDPRDGANTFPPFGIFDIDDANPIQVGVAPVDFKIRDLTLLAFGMHAIGESLDVSMTVSSGPTNTTTHVCNLTPASSTCDAGGPITVPKHAFYVFNVQGSNVGAGPSTAVGISFGYRATLG